MYADQCGGILVRLLFYGDPRLRSGFVAYISAIVATLAVIIFEDDWQRALQFVLSIFVILLPVLSISTYLYTGQGFLLGFLTVMASFGIVEASWRWKIWFVYSLLLVSFHFFEFLILGISNPMNLRPGSFLLDHSVGYWAAISCSLAEFFVWLYFDRPYDTKFFIPGLLISLVGDILRKLAIYHARVGFTHLVAYQKKANHVLVTTGVYSLVRHPAYVGFFLFSCGTQILLGNIFCLMIFGYISWVFLRDRIYDEERYLVAFFGQHYLQYQRDVYIGLPLVPRYIPLSG